MNRRTSRGILAIALSTILTQGAPALGQTPTTTGTKKPAEATDTIKGSSVEKKSEAVAYDKNLVSDLDVKIKDLETQLSRNVSAAGSDAKRQVNELSCAAPGNFFAVDACPDPIRGQSAPANRSISLLARDVMPNRHQSAE